MLHYDTVIHLVAGGLGGTAGAIATCPLEVVKTRLQSSVANFNFSQKAFVNQKYQFCTCTPRDFHCLERILPLPSQTTVRPSFGIWKCIRHIVETEGARALFKGLGPNLVGVAPSRAIYFCTYSQTKNFCNSRLTPDTPLVHICSAACAGFTSCTITSPIWFIKTRLQLDQREYGRTSTLQCVRDVYNSKGIKGFYKGLSASYVGISETIIHFVIYEFLKANMKKCRENMDYCQQDKSTRDFIEFMLAGAISKTCASSLAYPHEVVRTRLRQEGTKYNSFFQTLFLVFKEEGYKGLYRGLGTQLVRQIPNTAIMMTVYEAVVYLLANYPYPVPSIQICEEEDEQYYNNS